MATDGLVGLAGLGGLAVLSGRLPRHGAYGEMKISLCLLGAFNVLFLSICRFVFNSPIVPRLCLKEF